jgi:hypothetical protein
MDFYSEPQTGEYRARAPQPGAPARFAIFHTHIHAHAGGKQRVPKTLSHRKTIDESGASWVWTGLVNDLQDSTGPKHPRREPRGTHRGYNGAAPVGRSARQLYRHGANPDAHAPEPAQRILAPVRGIRTESAPGAPVHPHPGRGAGVVSPLGGGSESQGGPHPVFEKFSDQTHLIKI